jgi:hypothetical protein
LGGRGGAGGTSFSQLSSSGSSAAELDQVDPHVTANTNPTMASSLDFMRTSLCPVTS